MKRSSPSARLDHKSVHNGEDSDRNTILRCSIEPAINQS